MERRILEGLIVLDLETTGLDVDSNGIIEIGAVKITAEGTAEYQQVVNPSQQHISPYIFKLCRGLTEKQVRSAPSFRSIRGEFLDFLGEHPIACHNASFDIKFLNKELGYRPGNKVLDTLELFCLVKPSLKSYSLDKLLKDYLGEDREEEHRALQDARDTLALLELLLNELREKNGDITEKTLTFMNGTDWPWLPVIRQLSGGLVSQKYSEIATAPEKKPRPGRVTGPYGPGDLDRLLKDEAVWQPHLGGYRYNKQQNYLARSIAEAFKKGEFLFTEAPTGSGKTLAYLVSAVLGLTENGQRVYISTNTKNLQQQIHDELPVICRALAVTGIKMADIKGINNYACKFKVQEEYDRFQGSMENTADKLARLFLHNWAFTVKGGEVEEIPYWFRKHNSILELILPLIRCRREDCHGLRCRYYRECFYWNKVEEMEESHLCVINHSLLLTWPGNYPGIKRLIIDEAHTLEEKAYTTFTDEVSLNELNTLLYRLRPAKGEGYLDFIAADFNRKKLQVNILPVTEALAEAGECLQEVSGAVGELTGDRDNYYPLQLIIAPHQPEWEPVNEITETLSYILKDLADKLETVLKAAYDEEEEPGNLKQQGINYAALFRDNSLTLHRCFNEDREDHCYYLESRKQWNRRPAGDSYSSNWSFRAAPLDISDHFHEKVLTDIDAVVLTSATLAERGRYNRLVRTLGFDKADNPVKSIEPLPSPFNYRDNCILALPEHELKFGTDEFLDYMARVIVEVASFLGGRTLVLFSSKDRLERVAGKARRSLEKENITVFDGTDMSRHAIITALKQDSRAVIFGSRSFFEGIDIKGPALSCVIIEKLPFTYAGDILNSAIGRYLYKDRSFFGMVLPQMIRSFRQQFGRLLRSGEDKGVVMVMSQLKKGEKFYNSITAELPPVPVWQQETEELLSRLKGQYHDWGMV